MVGGLGSRSCFQQAQEKARAGACATGKSTSGLHMLAYVGLHLILTELAPDSVGPKSCKACEMQESRSTKFSYLGLAS